MLHREYLMNPRTSQKSQSQPFSCNFEHDFDNTVGEVKF